MSKEFNKTLPEVFSDIYRNTEEKREQINIYLKKLVMLIKTPEDAAVISPIIKDFMEVAVKNDEHIVRVAQIIQRLETANKKNSNGDDLLTEAEKQQLLKNLHIEVASIQEETEEIEDDIFSLRERGNIS
jgi:predicted  nucleic acid-binding Zn-ribbon protein